MKEDLQRLRSQALTDYEVQMILLERQNKGRLLTARAKVTGHETKALSPIRVCGHIVQ